MQKKRPLLSICVPSYKKAEWLKASLSITLEQVSEFDELAEVVVSDDASGDNSVAVLEELKQSYPTCLHYYTQKENLKNNKNYLFTIEKATGAFIWLLGNDDFIRPGAVKKVLEVIQVHKEINFIYMSYSFFMPPSSPDLLPNIEDIAIEEDQMPPCFYGKHIFSDKLLSWLGEIPAYDALCFTPMYASIVRRDFWRDAFAFNAQADFFRKLDGSFGYAAYLVKNGLHQPAYYIAYPYVLASKDITWGSFAASACLRNMPVLYDLLENEGVPKNVLHFIRTDYLKLIKSSIPYVLQYRSLFYHNEFSFLEHTKRFWTYLEYWKNLIYIFPCMLKYWISPNFLGPILKKILHPKVYSFLRSFKRKEAIHGKNN